MSSGTARARRPTTSLGHDSRYERMWNAVALLAAGVWMSIAILQTPRLPLLCIALGLGAIGGMLFVRSPASTSTGKQQYLAGALIVAGLVVVTVGIGHHVIAGLTTVGLLAGSSPSVIRWIAGE
jgi:hypothetical protein